MIPSSETSPGVQRPDSDAPVVSARCCAMRAQAIDRTNRATPREMSARLGSFRRASRKSEDTA